MRSGAPEFIFRLVKYLKAIQAKKVSRQLGYLSLDFGKEFCTGHDYLKVRLLVIMDVKRTDNTARKSILHTSRGKDLKLSFKETQYSEAQMMMMS